MAISDSDYKILWGRAAGICSNPDCREDLTIVLESTTRYNIGEMAHIIARSAHGPRGQVGGGTDTYDNLVLLCPTCHSRIDKAPGEYPEELLRKWKGEHERQIRSAGCDAKFDSSTCLKRAVSYLLRENRALWHHFGPHSQTATTDPNSNLHIMWKFKKLKTILPNNRRIINIIRANLALLSEDEHEAFLMFELHAGAFEKHQFDRLDTYPLFPKEFEELFRQ